MSSLSIGQQHWRHSLFEWVGGVIVAPTDTLRDVVRQNGWLQALVVVLVIAAVDALLQVATTLRGGGAGSDFTTFDGFGTTAATEFDGLMQGIAIGSAFSSIIWRPAFWVAITLVYYVIAYLFGGRGAFQGLLAGIGFAHVPMLFALPFSAASALLSVFGPGFGLLGSLAVVPVLLLTGIWSLVLQMIAVREAMSLRTGQAMATVLIPIVVVVAFVVLVLLALMALVIGLISANT